MKTLYLIGGPMGVGKTATARALNRSLPASVMLDGDWCWAADPFVVTDETKAVVMDNIAHVLGNFLRCPTYENVVFSWVMHEQAVIDELLARLPVERMGCRVRAVSLVCSEGELRRRIEGDVSAGVRDGGAVGRALAYLPRYERLATELIDVTELSPEQAAEAVGRI